MQQSADSVSPVPNPRGNQVKQEIVADVAELKTPVTPHIADELENIVALETPALQQLLIELAENLAQCDHRLSTIETLSQDPGQEMNVFRERCIEALSIGLSQLGRDAPYTNLSMLRDYTHVTEVIIAGLEDNPTSELPSSLNLLAASLISFIENLEKERQNLPVLHRSLSQIKEIDYKVFLENWCELYTTTLLNLESVSSMHGFKLSNDVDERCKLLLERQLEWYSKEQGPLQQQWAPLVDVWDEVLRFAAVVGDDRHSMIVDKVTRELLELMDSADNDDREFDKIFSQGEGEEEDLENRWGALCNCLDTALQALTKCQSGIQSVQVWYSELLLNSTDSDEFRIALLALSDADISETPPFVERLLQKLSSKELEKSSSQRRLKTLESFLEKPGAIEEFIKLFDPNENIALNPLAHSKLIEKFEERLSKHESLIDVAMKDVSMQSTELERSKLIARYARQGVIWSERARLAYGAIVN